VTELWTMRVMPDIGIVPPLPRPLDLAKAVALRWRRDSDGRTSRFSTCG
jgi:hypothetical protein